MLKEILESIRIEKKEADYFKQGEGAFNNLGYNKAAKEVGEKINKILAILDAVDEEYTDTEIRLHREVYKNVMLALRIDELNAKK